MNVYGATDVGRRRKDNQDSYTVRLLGEDAALLVVCDGMGGAQAGGVASSTAVEVFAAAVEEEVARGLPNGPGGALEAACAAANEKVFRLSRERPDYEGMGTTLVAALVRPGGTTVANVGDSRCYLLAGDAIRQVTVDHSWVQLMVDRGELTADEARLHPQKNLITRALGVEGEVRCDLTELSPEPGDRLLLCTDGLTNVLDDGTILELARREREPERLCGELVRLTLERGAPDNVTAVLASL